MVQRVLAKGEALSSIRERERERERENLGFRAVSPDCKLVLLRIFNTVPSLPGFLKVYVSDV
jgi:hypothetical protein